MVEIIAISVAAKVAELLVAPVARQLRYLWDYKSNMENLVTEMKKLESRRDTVQHSVDDARRNGEEIEKHVESWLDRVKIIVDDATELVDEGNQQQANVQCSKGFPCPDFSKRYRSSKKAAGKLKAVVRLEQEAGGFQKVSYRTIPEQTWLQTRLGYNAFGSREFILKNIIQALRNPDVNIVGIYGMGGIGKTTLAKQVASQAKQDNLFDEVVFVEVSQIPDFKKIQGVIADCLGLKFSEETVPGRANRLCERLKKEEEKKKVLLILDNIWRRIELDTIGIPLESDGKGLKLLLTTRSSNVLTNEMDCPCNFHVETLKEEDTWSLFKSIAGTCVDHPDLQPTAFDVANKCGGIPVAIVTIAKALRNKALHEWKNALQELTNPSWKNFEGVTKEVYACIKLSYNHLESDEIKQLFLLCSSTECPYDTSIQDLLRYGIGLSLFRGFNTFEAALNRVATLVSKLKAASLLLETSHSEWFAMHDVVYDVARSIASQDEHAFSVIDDFVPRDWVYEDTLKNCTRISLQDILELPEKLSCPKLKFLYVKPKVKFSRVPEQFFLEMPRLQVLHLIEMDLRSQPLSLGHLIDLKTLCLDKCILIDVAIIGNLKKLEILSFQGSWVKELPEEMHQLTRLRLLDLSDCSQLRIIPATVMSSLTQLEALYLVNTSIQWETERVSIGRSNASLDELKKLSNLTTLEIHIPDAEIRQGLFSQKLERYKIFIGDRSKQHWYDKYETSRTLKLSHKTSEVGFITELNGIRDLHLSHIPSVINVLNELCRKGTPELRHLHVANCSSPSFIIDTIQSLHFNALLTLETLYLGYLEKLERICCGQIGAESCRQLRIIEVYLCNRLNKIFSISTDKGLPQLEKVEVRSCSSMNAIFAMERQHDVNNTQVLNKPIEFNQLRSVILISLPCLKSFCTDVMKTPSPLQKRQSPLATDTKAKGIFVLEDKLDVPESLFNEMVVLPNLEILKLSKLNVDRIWHNQLPAISCNCQNLTRLIIEDCCNLKHLFSASMVLNLVQLQHLLISDCPILEEMVVEDELTEEGRRDTILFPQLNYLCIRGLGKLRRWYSGNYIEFPALKKLKIQDCFELSSFIFDDKVGFPKLETMEVSNMDNLEKIWHHQLPTLSSNVQNLTHLIISNCCNPKYLFSDSMVNSFVQLRHLEISKCLFLEEMVVTEEFKEEGRRDMVLFPQLTYLKMTGLEHLRRLYSGNYIEFPSLTELEIERNFELGAFIFDDKVGFPRLEKIKISHMFNLRRIWHNQLPEDSFYKLTSLEVDNCCDLLTVIPSNMCGRVLRLDSLSVCNCASVEEIFDIQGINFEEWLSISETQLRNLYIEYLPSMKHVWNKDPQGMLSFGNLQDIQVVDCYDLKCLLPASVAKNLLKLECLRVRRSRVLEELVVEEGLVEEEAARFQFPRLNTLKLSDLPELGFFYRGKHTVEVPVLKIFTLYGCDRIKIFPPYTLSIHETNTKQQPFFRIEEAFPCLEELNFNNEEEITMMWEGHTPTRLFHTLKSLEVCDDESAVLPLQIIERFYNLENLSLYFGSYKRMFSGDGVQETTRTLIKLKKLVLCKLQDLKYMWKQDSRLDLILQNLQVLGVNECKSLISLLPPSASFRNLAILKVHNCVNLKNFVTSSTAKSLVHLIKMNIKYCHRITEIVRTQEGAAEDKIIFHRLESLSLKSLPSLASFCSGNYSLEFPCLKKLKIVGCDKMKIFSQGVLKTEALQKVRFNWKSIEPCWDFDINTTIQEEYGKRTAQGSEDDISDFEFGDSSSDHVNDQSF